MLSGPEALAPHHDLAAFDCGKAALNDWLQVRALRNHQHGFTVVMVIHDEGRVVAFYGLAPTAVAPKLAPRRIRTGQPPDPLPCLLMAQLAVDLSYQGRGLSDVMLLDAFERIVQSADISGGRALIVNAVDHDAIRFWRSRGFAPSPQNPFQLLRSIADIRASLAASR